MRFIFLSYIGTDHLSTQTAMNDIHANSLALDRELIVHSCAHYTIESLKLNRCYRITIL